MTHSNALPPTYLITPEPPEGRPLTDFIADLDRTLATGVRLLQLRAKTVTAEQYAWLADHALACGRRHGARVLLNAPPDVALAHHADGLHLTSKRLMTCASRPLPPGLLVSAACHDEHQIRHAERIGVDFVTLSPVLPTATHTTAIPLGWARFRELAALTSMPVYALGGMSAETLADARDAGAQGIAAIRALWQGVVEKT